MRRARRILAVTFLAALGVAPAEAVAPGQELMDLTNLVRYLKSRVRSEAPGVLRDPSELTRLLQEELDRFDLVLPETATLDFAASDLKIAGVLLEEQMRRRRSARRRELLADEDLELSEELEALLADAERYVPQFAPEVTDIFAAIRQERFGGGRSAPAGPATLIAARRDASDPAPPPGAAAAEDLEPTLAAPRLPSARALPSPAEAGGAGEEVPKAPEPDLSVLRDELRAALDAAPPRWSPEDDPFYGDRSFTVASPGTPPETERTSAPLAPPGQLLAELRARVALRRARAAAAPVASPPASPAPPMRSPPIAPPRPEPDAEAALPPDLAREVPRAHGFVDPAAGVTVAPDAVVTAPDPVPIAPDPRVVAVFEALVPQVAGQVSNDREFAEALRAAMGLLGLRAPEEFRPGRGSTPSFLAARYLRVAGGPPDLGIASGVLGL